MIRQPFNTGWSFRTKVNEFAEQGGASAPEPIVLPHDAVIGTKRDPQLPSGASTGYFSGGTWEYSKSFHVPEEWETKRVILEFEGIYRSSLIYINDAYAGSWASGYTGFSVPINDFLVFGSENTVRVEARAHRDSRWYSGAGIYRPVHLVVAERVHVPLDGVVVTTTDLSSDFATLSVVTEISNSDNKLTTVEAETRIIDAVGTILAREVAPVTIGEGETTRIHQHLVVRDPQMWCLEAPVLHHVEVVLRSGGRVLDTARERFGIRQLHVDPVRGLRLNGRELKLRGACVHHDNGLIGAATIGRAEQRRVEILKGSGFNSIRSSHNPLSRAMLDACDEQGVLVMDEAFDSWTRSKSDFDYAVDFEGWWEKDIEAMVRKDRNHPCVFAYSIGNEIGEIGSPHGAMLSRRIANRVRDLDPSRFVTSGISVMLAILKEWTAQAMANAEDLAALEGMGINTMLTQLGEFGNLAGSSELATKLTAETFSTLDISGLNYLEARYELDRELFPNRVIVGSETFPTMIDKLWALVLDNPHVIGDFTWTGWDYLGEAGIGRVRYEDMDDGGVNAVYPWLLAHVGDIDITGERRPASFYREIVFGLRDSPYIAVRRPENHDRHVVSTPWAWSDSIASWSWPQSVGQPVTVEVYSDADEVELILNGTTIGRAPAGPANRYRSIFETSYQPGTLLAVAYSKGLETGRHQLRTATGATQLFAQSDRGKIEANDSDLAFISLNLVDAHGTTLTCADEIVSIELMGPGVIQGFGTANPVDEHTRFTDSSHRTYEGRALAIIRPTAKGQITITASTESGATAHVSISVGEEDDQDLGETSIPETAIA